MKNNGWCSRHEQALPCPSCDLTDGEGSLPLFAHARRSDPKTSHQAAASLSSDSLRESQAMVLGVLERYGPMPDFELVPLLNGKLSPSGARTRRSELAEKGVVVDTGKRIKTLSGRMAVIWGAA